MILPDNAGPGDPGFAGTDAGRKSQELTSVENMVKARESEIAKQVKAGELNPLQERQAREDLLNQAQSKSMAIRTASRTEIGVMEGGSYAVPGQASQKSEDLFSNILTRAPITYNVQTGQTTVQQPVQTAQTFQQPVSNEIVSGGKVQGGGTLGTTFFVGNKLSPTEVISSPVPKNVSLVTSGITRTPSSAADRFERAQISENVSSIIAKNTVPINYSRELPSSWGGAFVNIQGVDSAKSNIVVSTNNLDSFPRQQVLSHEAMHYLNSKGFGTPEIVSLSKKAMGGIVGGNESETVSYAFEEYYSEPTKFRTENPDLAKKFDSLLGITGKKYGVQELTVIVDGKEVPYSSISGKIATKQIIGSSYDMTPGDIALYMGIGSLALAGAKAGAAALSPLAKVIGSDVSRISASQAGSIYYPTITETITKGLVGVGAKAAGSAKIIPEVVAKTAFKHPLLTQAALGLGISFGFREGAIQVQPTQAKEFIKSKKGQEIVQGAEEAVAKSFEGDWLGGMVAALPIRALPEETPLIGGNIKKQRETYFGFIESKGLSEETTKAYKDVYNISAFGELAGTITGQVGTELKSMQIIFPSTVKLAGSKMGSLGIKEAMGLAMKEAPKFAYLVGAESLTAQAIQDVSRGKNPNPMDYATTLGISLALGVPFGVGIYGLGLATSPIAKGIAKAAYYVGGTAGDFPETLFADPIAGVLGKAVRAPIVSITPSFTPSTSITESSSITESQSPEQKSGYDKYLQKRLASDVIAARGSKEQKAADALIRSFTLSSTPSSSTTVTSSPSPSVSESQSFAPSFTLSGGIPTTTATKSGTGTQQIGQIAIGNETISPSEQFSGTPSKSQSNTVSSSLTNNTSSLTNFFTETNSQSQTNTSSLSQTFSFTPTPSATPTLTARWAPFIPPFFGSGDLAGKQKKTISNRFIDEFTLAFAGLGDLSSPVYFGKSSSIALTRKTFKQKKPKKRKGKKFKRGDLVGFNKNGFKAFFS